MKHLKSDYEAISKTIQECPLDSEEDIRKLHQEVVDFVMAFSQELEKQNRAMSKLKDESVEMGEAISELAEDVDTIMGSAPNFLDLELGTRIVQSLQKGMELTATLVKTLEDDFHLDDIRKQQIRAHVEPYLQTTLEILAELEEIIDKEEEDDDDDGDADENETGDPDSDDRASGTEEDPEIEEGA